jgi:hypothetical protein
VLQDRAAPARLSAKGQHGREPAALGREREVPNRVNPAMNVVQQSPSHPSRDRFLAEAELTQLIDRHHSVLLLGDLGNP